VQSAALGVAREPPPRRHAVLPGAFGSWERSLQPQGERKGSALLRSGQLNKREKATFGVSIR